MRVVAANNVNEAYELGLELVNSVGMRRDSRNGPVITVQEPVTTVYWRPRERVLFSESRDANPFFHLLESVWMLAGRRDVAFPARYARQIAEYAEKDGDVHGAYGHRWRHVLGFDQLDVLVKKLLTNPDDRQCVLQMWDAREATITAAVGRGFTNRGVVDVDCGSDDLRGSWKDRPCNTHVYFRVRREPVTRGGEGIYDDYLDMTVCCRSNDAIWGCYGANAVHFGALLEYVAAASGLLVGAYYQMSNDLHVYDNDLLKRCYPVVDSRDLYVNGSLEPYHMVSDAPTFLAECEETVDLITKHVWQGATAMSAWAPRNSFLSDVVWPAAVAHEQYKRENRPAARSWTAKIAADDWRLACAEWLERRAKS